VVRRVIGGRVTKERLGGQQFQSFRTARVFNSAFSRRASLALVSGGAADAKQQPTMKQTTRPVIQASDFNNGAAGERTEVASWVADRHHSKFALLEKQLGVCVVCKCMLLCPTARLPLGQASRGTQLLALDFPVRGAGSPPLLKRLCNHRHLFEIADGTVLLQPDT
jgi:hypothetical protein